MNDKIINKTSRPFAMGGMAIFEFGLSSFEIAVFFYLNGKGATFGNAFPSYDTIASSCGMSKRKAVMCIDKLIEVGLLEKEIRLLKKKGNTSNLYITIDPYDVLQKKKSSEEATEGVHDMHPPISAPDAPPQCTPCTPLVHDMHPPSAQDAPYNNPLKDIIKKQQQQEGVVFLSNNKLGESKALHSDVGQALIKLGVPASYVEANINLFSPETLYEIIIQSAGPNINHRGKWIQGVLEKKKSLLPVNNNQLLKAKNEHIEPTWLEEQKEAELRPLTPETKAYYDNLLPWKQNNS